MRRMVRTGLWLMIAVIGILIIVAAMFAVLPVRPGPSPDKPLVAPFTLQQYEGRSITERAIPGRPGATTA